MDNHLCKQKKGVLDAHINILVIYLILALSLFLFAFFLIHVALYKLEFINSKLLRETEKKRLTRRLSKGLKM